MPLFTVNRYLVISTEVEAETAEDALLLEEMTATDITATSVRGFPTEFDWSSNTAWVDDENGETVWEG